MNSERFVSVFEVTDSGGPSSGARKVSITNVPRSPATHRHRALGHDARWIRAASPQVPRDSASAVRPRPRTHFAVVETRESTVLVLGGRLSNANGSSAYTGEASEYDPRSNGWRTLPSGRPRGGHAAALLDDGRVAVAGGLADFGEWWGIEPIDVLRTGDTAWASVCNLREERQFEPHMIPLRHSVLVFGGGANGIESVFTRQRASRGDTETMTDDCRSEVLALPDGFPKEGMTVTVLDDGRVLVAGGRAANDEATPSAWILGECL